VTPPTPEHSIYAVKYAGPFSVYSGYNVWQWDMATNEFDLENWYLWCITGGDATVVVDTGADPELTQRRKKSELVESPAVALGRLGIEAADVEHVVLTHLHWDHAGGVHLFPRATFYLQAAEDWPSAFSMDLAGCLRTYEKLRAAASSPDIIFPGHDPLMYDAYPRIAEGVTQLV